MITFIGEIAEMVPCLLPTSINKHVHELFNEYPSLQGIVIIDDDAPIGLISKTQFYQKIGSLYGYSLYMNRTIDLLLHNNPLIVDYADSVTNVSTLAMNRPEEDVFNYVIVTKNGKFFGVVSIQKLLLKVAEIQSVLSTFLNPLTKLPGNHMIEDKLKQVLSAEQFSVLYIDLDHFKEYNDTYGFKKGDQLIQETSKIIQRFINSKKDFIGHIGGDDFVVIFPHHHYEFICQSIIKDFNERIQLFYDKKDIEREGVYTENRRGSIEKIPLVAISIAVVTNQKEMFHTSDQIVDAATRLKKICKMNSYSCYFTNHTYVN
ncbi:GGDEF domain-containing protein [Halalkalibacter urbisdiaboli]|uniref:GGDEF domain-containing protein n=1 Tax=Halalkalibacter urbisdiaboli TaxID=1960589 RepID=UPI000B42D9D4|nr:GGDEF domain-containing protein [Halalkalibacter urbisdiaboli]